MNGQIIDLSHPLSPQTPVYPGDPGVELEVLASAFEPTADRLRSMNNSRLTMGVHNGTHIDAPFHFFSDRATIDCIPLEHCCGDAMTLDLSSTRQKGIIDREDLCDHLTRDDRAKIVLIHTGWDRRWWSPNYFDEHPVLTQAAAGELVRQGVKVVGVDFPSVDRDPFEAHLELLGNDVLIVENLRGLEPLIGASCDFFAIPLAISGRDASPVRAFARIRMT